MYFPSYGNSINVAYGSTWWALLRQSVTTYNYAGTQGSTYTFVADSIESYLVRVSTTDGDYPHYSMRKYVAGSSEGVMVYASDMIEAGAKYYQCSA